jgi:hypothetical protein
VVLHAAARHFDWNLPAYPTGNWYFNPFAWQLLFVLGAWCALGGAQQLLPLLRFPAAAGACAAYLLFALIMTMRSRFPAIAEWIPTWLDRAVNPVDKTNLDPLRLLHFMIIAFLVVRFLPRDWRGLHSPILRPAIICGQQSLEVFCVGIFLSAAAHIALVQISNLLWMQVLVSVLGIGLMCVVAWVSILVKTTGQAARAIDASLVSERARC